MKIRFIKKREIGQASRIVGQNYSRAYERSSKKEMMAMFTQKTMPPKYIVAEEKGRIVGLVGYVQSWMDYGVFCIFWVNVEKKHQGKGIGYTLVKKAIEKIKNIRDKKDPPRLILLTATSANSRFYGKKFGFERLAEFKDGNYLMGLQLDKKNI